MEEIRIVKNDNDADKLLEQIKEAKTEIQRYKTMAETKIKEIEYLLEKRINGINYTIEINKSMLMAYFISVKQKESKTQFSYGLLNGTLIMKKPSQKIKHDEKQLINWAEQSLSNQNRYTSVVETTKLDWALLKKDLSISNGMIVNRLTGEVLENIKGLSIEEVKESFDIKI